MTEPFHPPPELLARTKNGIIMSPPLAPRVWDGSKTVTRRMSKQWLKLEVGDLLYVRENWCIYLDQVDDLKRRWLQIQYLPGALHSYVSPPMLLAPGERADWVTRESARKRAWREKGRGLAPLPHIRPSLLLPRWAARMVLRITEPPRLERAQDITKEEAFAEAVPCWVCGGPLTKAGAADCACYSGGGAVDSFQATWEKLHTKPGERWSDNPEVVRIAFEKVTSA